LDPELLRLKSAYQNFKAADPERDGGFFVGEQGW
jgi:hypothetical protein